jgi:hypothetical protein
MIIYDAFREACKREEQLNLLKTSTTWTYGSMNRTEDIRNLANHLLDVARKCDSPLHEQAGLAIQSLLKERMRYL